MGPVDTSAKRQDFGSKVHLSILNMSLGNLDAESERFEYLLPRITSYSLHSRPAGLMLAGRELGWLPLPGVGVSCVGRLTPRRGCSARLLYCLPALLF